MMIGGRGIVPRKKIRDAAHSFEKRREALLLQTKIPGPLLQLDRAWTGQDHGIRLTWAGRPISKDFTRAANVLSIDGLQAKFGFPQRPNATDSVEFNPIQLVGQSSTQRKIVIPFPEASRLRHFRVACGT